MPLTETLVRAVRAGETSAFTELVRRYQRAAVVTAHAVLNDFHLAQDTVQEAFVIAHGRLGELRNAASFGPWLLSIARRQALRVRRDRGTESPLPEHADCERAESHAWMEPYEEIVRLLVRLPEHERIVVVMRYVDGRSVKDIAEATARPVGTVTKQLSRAIGRLRGWLVEVQQ